MEMFYIPIIIFVALFLLAIFIIISYKKHSKPKETKKEEPKQVAKPAEEPKQEKIIPQDIDLVSRPDFSDIVKIEEPSINKLPNTSLKNSNLRVSDNIRNSGSAYGTNYGHTKNSNLSDEIANLSPELKAIVFGNILNDRD